MFRVLLTGSTGSIGASILDKVISSFPEFELVLTTRREVPTADEVATTEGQTIRYLSIDLESDNFNQVPEDIDILINCAGVPSGKSFVEDISDAEYSKIMQINAAAPFKLCRRVLPHMKRQGFGRIVNVNSIWGERGSEQNGVYHMSKHALRGLTRAIAKEYGRYGVTCNDVSPGAVNSEMVRVIAQRIASEQNSDFDTVIESFNSSQARGSMIEPCEVAETVAFLIRHEASGINGQSLVVDGGTIC